MCQSTQTKSTPLLQGNGVLNPILKMEALRRKLQATSAYSGAFICREYRPRYLWDQGISGIKVSLGYYQGTSGILSLGYSFWS